MTYSVVWFKRDMRLHDHAPLVRAAKQGPILCLVVIEPSLWAAPDAANQHYQFLLESLRDLYVALRKVGGLLQIATGEVPEVLEKLHAVAPFTGLYSHQETGNAITFRRDLAVGRWCRKHGVPWHETQQFGVVRGLKSRNTWQTQWDAHMALPLAQQPNVLNLKFVALPWVAERPPQAELLGLDLFDPAQRQTGGRVKALAVLHSFLNQRCGQYRGGISSPLSAPTACSRLSPYLAIGCISLREVVQTTRYRIAQLPPEASRQKQGLTAFISRLYWHCHFIQKLESQPDLEYRNLHSGYDGLRENDWNPAHFEALVAGRTGWPLVDACVAMLKATGWINFRMRAMLVSVAAYPLWLHWQPVGEWLATQFLDYEPGIHWSQMQMQSGTTGINVTRVYNPIKQAQDHDPQGVFVRHWLPAMRQVPDTWLFEPWKMPPELQQRIGVRVGVDIAQPLVDLQVATRQAKTRLHALRAQPDVKAAKAAIVEKHGSRKRPAPRARKQTADAAQMGLAF